VTRRAFYPLEMIFSEAQLTGVIGFALPLLGMRRSVDLSL